MFALLFVFLLTVSQPRVAIAEESGSPCVPTQAQVEEYEEDGTLDERIAHVEELGHDEPSEGLIERALAREQDVLDAQSVEYKQSEFISWDSSMPATGSAKAVALYIDFPGEPFAEGDTLGALQSLFGMDADGGLYPSGIAQPYESVHDYYARASLNKLSIGVDVIAYEAQHKREEYTDTETLLLEAMDALNDTVHFSKYDGNRDGIIDTVYYHFAGGDSGWGGTWWSYTTSVEAQRYQYDGVWLATYVTLHQPSNTRDGVRCAIHETGHTLGLPDLYVYTKGDQMLKDGQVLGAGTFDMMFNNTGEQNGLFKWFLGWLDPNQVTRVVANADGVQAYTVGNKQAAVGQSNNDGSLDVPVSCFTTDNLTSGGITIVSNEDKGMFSSYYLLQYDHTAGNQQVALQPGSQGSDLPAGLRIFRVQADLDDSHKLIHTNTYGQVHNQFYELVDPDVDKYHDWSGDAFMAAGTTIYGCMLYPGDDPITPVSTPSTNFFETIDAGFTGLSLELVSGNDDGGTVRISYSEEHKPDTGNIEVTPAEGSAGQVRGAGIPLTLQTSWVTALEPSAAQPFMTIDNDTWQYGYNGYDLGLTGTTLTMSFEVDAPTLVPGTTCTLKLPAGFLRDVGGAGSAEQVITTTVSDEVAALSEYGPYPDAVISATPEAYSDVVDVGNNLRAFFRIDGGRLLADVIDVTSPTELTEYVVKDYEQLDATLVAGTQMQDDGNVRLWLANRDRSEQETRYRLDVAPSTWTVVQKLDGWNGNPEEFSPHDLPEGWLPEGAWLRWVTRRDEETWILYTTETEEKQTVVAHYGADGTLVQSTPVDFAGVVGDTYRLDVSPSGMVAVTTFSRWKDSFALSYGRTPQESVILAADLSFTSRLTMASKGCVLWLDDERLMAVGESYHEFSGGAGAPDLSAEGLSTQSNAEATLHYNITESYKKPVEKPTDPSAPVGTPQPANPATPNPDTANPDTTKTTGASATSGTSGTSGSSATSDASGGPTDERSESSSQVTRSTPRTSDTTSALPATLCVLGIVALIVARRTT